MATINSILIISLPAIFRGIQLDPLALGQSTYVLWILLGYMVVTAVLLVTFGRISDMVGRVKMYNLGCAVFTLGSLLLTITPGIGDQAASELLLFRVVQGIGGAFLFANSAALITDAPRRWCSAGSSSHSLFCRPSSAACARPSTSRL